PDIHAVERVVGIELHECEVLAIVRPVRGRLKSWLQRMFIRARAQIPDAERCFSVTLKGKERKPPAIGWPDAGSVVGTVVGDARDSMAFQLQEPKITASADRLLYGEGDAVSIGCNTIGLIQTRREGRCAPAPCTVEPLKQSRCITEICQCSAAGGKLRPTRR